MNICEKCFHHIKHDACTVNITLGFEVIFHIVVQAGGNGSQVIVASIGG